MGRHGELVRWRPNSSRFAWLHAAARSSTAQQEAKEKSSSRLRILFEERRNPNEAGLRPEFRDTSDGTINKRDNSLH
jgi:hypothetical protein